MENCRTATNNAKHLTPNADSYIYYAIGNTQYAINMMQGQPSLGKWAVKKIVPCRLYDLYQASLGKLGQVQASPGRWAPREFRILQASKRAAMGNPDRQTNSIEAK